MKVHAFSPLVVCETSISGFRRTLIKYYKDHSFDSSKGLITGELNGKVLVHKDPKFAPFFKEVRLKIEEYAKLFSFDLSKYDLNFVKSWYTVCDPKFNVPPHYHSCSHISFVYYLNVEKNDPLVFKFDNPNEWFGDSFSFCTERDGINSLTHRVQPLPETLLIFPGKINHYTSSGRNYNRMCIAGDVLLTLKENLLQFESGLLPTQYWSSF
jgi:hypothetical protein